MSPLFSPSFWFDLSPNALSPGFDKAFFVAFSLLVLAGAVARVMARHKKDDRYLVKAYLMVGDMLVAMGLLGMVFFFFTYEEIYLLGARFWFLVWGIGFLFWISYIVKYVKVKIPAMRAEVKEKNQQNEYLPRSKRRKK